MYDNFDFLKLSDLTLSDIKKYQPVFCEDLKRFSFIDYMFIYSELNYILWFAISSEIKQPEVIRVYLENPKTHLLIPIVISDNTTFNNYDEYGISEIAFNELCCYLTLYRNVIKKIQNGETEDDALQLSISLYPLSLFVKNQSINEAFKLSVDESLLPRCIWIDSGRPGLQHFARIKFQHNLSIKDSEKWASITFESGYPVRNLKNKDNKLSNHDIDIIRKFVEVNDALIRDAFQNPMTKYNFLNKCVFVNSNLEEIKPDKFEFGDETLYAVKKINNTISYVYDKKLRLMNILVDGKLILPEWIYTVNNYNAALKQFSCLDKDYNECLFDIYGNVIQ